MCHLDKYATAVLHAYYDDPPMLKRYFLDANTPAWNKPSHGVELGLSVEKRLNIGP